MSAAPSVLRCLAVLALCGLLGACDQLGIESGTEIAARKELEGKAIGSACRQAMRALEDCYTLNKKASKAAIFAGWREMDEYMRENKLEGIAPVIPRTPPAPPPDADAAPDATPPAKDKAAHH
jgi:hypothetical protein